MEYEIKNIEYIENPVELTYGDIQQRVCITVGIVGDTHGFIQKNKVDIVIPSDKTMAEAPAYVEGECETWKNNNYQ